MLIPFLSQFLLAWLLRQPDRVFDHVGAARMLADKVGGVANLPARRGVHGFATFLTRTARTSQSGGFLKHFRSFCPALENAENPRK